MYSFVPCYCSVTPHNNPILRSRPRVVDRMPSHQPKPPLFNSFHSLINRRPWPPFLFLISHNVHANGQWSISREIESFGFPLWRTSSVSWEGPSGIAPGCTLEPGTLPGSWHRSTFHFLLLRCNSSILFTLQLCFPCLGSNVKLGLKCTFIL